MKQNKMPSRRIILYFGSILIVLILISGCKSSRSDVTILPKEEVSKSLVFLDKTAAENQILKDHTDGFFESLSTADMSIQLKKTQMPNSRSESLKLYQELLRSEMENFTLEEEKFMREVFDSTEYALNLLNSNLFPKHIELIKTNTNHYGPNVYYTREDAIILPKNIFIEPSVKAQMPIMLHEIFHILSRYNKDFRDQMYALIGFTSFEEELKLPKELQETVLTNPDGVRRDYAINLINESGEEQLALPLIVSTKERYLGSMPSFFTYLSFDLFPLSKMNDGGYTLGVNSDGRSMLSVEHNADFFKQIKDNTQYIIHPDEIMADNFMMAVIAYKNKSYEGFSEEGRQLLMKVIEILKNFES